MAFIAQPQRHALLPTLSGSTASRVKTALSRRRQRGNAVLFTLLAMVIGGVVVAVGISQYQDADRAASVQSTVAEVNSIIGNAKQNYGQYSYNNLDTTIAIGSRVIPVSMHQGTGTNLSAQNKFGGAVTLVGSGATGLATLTYNGVPKDLCTSIVNGTQGMAQNISVGGTAVKTIASPITNISTLNAQCTAGETVIIAWAFGRN